MMKLMNMNKMYKHINDENYNNDANQKILKLMNLLIMNMMKIKNDGHVEN